MKKLLLTSALSCLTIPALFAQYYTNQNKVWAFGNSAGLDFTSGSPAFVATNISTSEGTANVCDASGNLLFYTDGVKVYDQTGTFMPSGSGIVSFATGSTSEAALIVPVIGTSTQYYVFSLENYGGSTNYCHLAYCKVDMSLHGGLGDVVAATIGTAVNNKLSEKMVAIRGNGSNIWLVVHMADTAQFLAYNITAGGIASPVVSTVGSFRGANCYTAGLLKASPDRQHLVAQVFPTTSTQGTELYDFDPATGIVSNCRTLDTATSQYGAEFSPDNTKLYCAKWGANVDQYDITGGSASAILATRTTVLAAGNQSDLKLGPDGKIYMRSAASATQLSCFATPNVSGSGCGYTTGVITLAGSSTMYMGFPNTYVTDSSLGGTLNIQNTDNRAALTVYPNPAHNEIFVRAEEMPGNSVTVTCYNIAGAVVSRQMVQLNNGSLRTSIPLTNLPTGVYNLSITDKEGKSYSKPFVVE